MNNFQRQRYDKDTIVYYLVFKVDSEVNVVLELFWTYLDENYIGNKDKCLRRIKFKTVLSNENLTISNKSLL